MAGRAINKDGAQQATKPQGFGGSDRDRAPQPKQQPQGQGQGQPTAFRVESANTLALANQRNNQELQSLLSNAIAAQQQTAKTTARVVDALMSGEYLHQQIGAELGAIQRERQQLAPQFETLTVENLLPSADEVIRELNLLPAGE